MSLIQQTPVGANAGLATLTLTFPAPLTAGSTVVVAVAQTVAASGRTYSIPGHTTAISHIPGRGAAVLYLHAIAGGGTTVAVTQAGGSVQNYQAVAYEVSGLAAVPPLTDSYTTPADQALQPCGAVGVTTTGPAFIVTATALSSTTTNRSAASGFFGQIGTTSQAYFQYQDAAAAVSLETATWSITGGTNRTGTSVIVAFGESSGGPGGAASCCWSDGD